MGLKKELEHLSSVRDTQRKKRAKSGIKRVALCGYTNAGKSTVLNEIIKNYDTTVINDESSRDDIVEKNEKLLNFHYSPNTIIDFF